MRVSGGMMGAVPRPASEADPMSEDERQQVFHTADVSGYPNLEEAQGDELGFIGLLRRAKGRGLH